MCVCVLQIMLNSTLVLADIGLCVCVCVCSLQVEQVRAELLQERAVRQDLECDKISLERQVKILMRQIAKYCPYQYSSKFHNVKSKISESYKINSPLLLEIYLYIVQFLVSLFLSVNFTSKWHLDVLVSLL